MIHNRRIVIPVLEILLVPVLSAPIADSSAD
jgi:hypothetical protein